MAGATYDDLPDADVRVVLTVPLQPPVLAPAAPLTRPAAATPTVLPSRPSHRAGRSRPSVEPVRRRHASSRGRAALPATLEATVVGVTAATIVLVTVAVALMLIDVGLR